MTEVLPTPPAPPAPPAPPQPDAKPWHDGSDAEMLGHLQNRGWDKLDATAAAKAAAKAHREAERAIGVPLDKIIRLPKDANDTAAWADMRTKLGVPADAKEYDYSAIKFADGKELPDEFKATISAALLDANVSKERAPGVVQALVKSMEKEAATEAGERSAKIALEKDELKANWGARFNANMIIAQNAAKTLGIPPEAVAAFEHAIGYAKTLDALRMIGTKIGEDAFVKDTSPGGNGPMTRDQALATLADRKADTVWVTKLMAGDTAVKREFDNLTRMAQ